MVWMTLTCRIIKNILFTIFKSYILCNNFNHSADVYVMWFIRSKANQNALVLSEHHTMSSVYIPSSLIVPNCVIQRSNLLPLLIFEWM